MEENEVKHLFSLELFSSIIIGIATIFAAWVAYQSSLWSGDSTENYSVGLAKINKANGMIIQGYQQYSLDMLAYLEYRKSSGTGFNAKDIQTKIMSPDMRKSIEWSNTVNEKVMNELNEFSKLAKPGITESEQKALLEQFTAKVEKIKSEASESIYKNPKNEDEIESWEIQSPKTDPNYEKALFDAAGKLYDEGIEQINKANYQNDLGDKYTLITVFFTIVLFFAGISTTLKKESLKLSFNILSTLLFVYSLIRMLMLEMH